MSISIIRFAVLLATCCICCESANILAFPTFPGYSHFIIIEPLLRALANKGHNVTVVSYFPRKTPLKNYHDIDVSHTLPLVTNNISAEYCLKNMRKSTDFMQFVWGSGHKMCHAIFKEKNIMDDLLNNGVKYDLVITELFGADCFVAFAHVFDIPLISIVTTIGLPWAHDRIANPVNPSYITNYFRPVKHPMTLYDRFMNTATFLYANAGYYFVSDLPINKFTNEYFNNTLPPLAEIYKKTSVIMTNSHYSFRQIQPFLPNFIEIGGIHLEPPKPLPKDLQELLDNSKEGVILVTFGSMLKSSSLPENILNSFKRAFARLPYKVIWKVEDHVADLPPNVVTKKWLPVKDVLEHPNMKLLIMHGGMATTIETINAGVPVLGMPMYADQPGNIQSLINKGMAIGVDYYEITEELFYNSIKKLITDPSYTENAKTLSKVFKDRENSPLDTAVYWTEYVIRHKGAPHLQSPAVNMPWYQLMLLDVILLTFVLLSSVILVIYFLIVSIKKFLFGSLTKKRKQA